MDTKELLKKVRKIEIKSRVLSQNIFAGEYHSAFKGRGMIFSEVREYQYGDDIRDIDWNVTARHNRPFVKVYEEERELTVMFLVDVSGSRNFGAVGQLKKEMMAEIAATLAFSSIQNNDKVGVVFFSDKIEKFIPPKKGRKHILLIIREIINFEPDNKATNIDCALHFMTEAIKKKCAAFLISDFIDDGKTPALTESASVTEDGTIVSTISNASLTECFDVECQVAHSKVTAVSAEIVTANARDYNTFEKKDAVKTTVFTDFTVTDDGFTAKIPPCSIVKFIIK